MLAPLNPPRPLAGRVALVTGAGGGIGRAIAEELGAAGAAVAVVARPEARADATVDAIRTAGGRAARFSADLYDLGSVPPLIHGIERELGEVDILVNNAATVMPLGPVTGVHPDAVLRALTINVGSVMTLAGAVIPEMGRRGWGRIANISGVFGDLASIPGGKRVRRVRSRTRDSHLEPGSRAGWDWGDSQRVARPEDLYIPACLAQNH
jgi:NAD(P)-dependent dehydrogenase (short-subunit alcohol dehydrogenase family)